MTLKEACDTVLKQDDLKPRSINGKLVTNCDEGVKRICDLMGHCHFDSEQNANMMIKMLSMKVGRLIKMQEGFEMAMQGKVAILAVPASPHGHVAVIYPAPKQMSGKWMKEVPMVANIGVENRIMKASEAFRHEPFCYTFK